MTERAPDVLVVDHAIDQSDHSAETRYQPAWLEMTADMEGINITAELEGILNQHKYFRKAARRAATMIAGVPS